MHRLVFAFAAILATLTCITPALAQTPAATPAASPETRPYTGLIEGVTRQYTPDPEMTPGENPEEFVLINVHLFRFDTGEHASASWEALTADASTSLTGSTEQTPRIAKDGDENAQGLHQGEIDDLGDRAWAVWLTPQGTGGDIGYYRALYVQDGEYLILVTAMGGAEDNTLLADKLARAVTEREAGNAPASFFDDGTSTGGIWNKLPLTGDPGSQGLTAFSDQVISID